MKCKGMMKANPSRRQDSGNLLPRLPGGYLYRLALGFVIGTKEISAIAQTPLVRALDKTHGARCVGDITQSNPRGENFAFLIRPILFILMPTHVSQLLSTGWFV